MNSPFFRRKLPLLAALLSLALAMPAVASEAPPPPKEDDFFTTTNVQLLWGGGFSDAQLGYYTKTQSMFTLTLNNFTQFKYGDSFFFVDMYQGDFVNPFVPGESAGNAKLYAEWHPRILINKFIDPKAPPAFGFIGNWGVAGEINIGSNFSAYLVGPSVDLFLPFNIYVGMAFYYRYSQLWIFPGAGRHGLHPHLAVQPVLDGALPARPGALRLHRLPRHVPVQHRRHGRDVPAAAPGRRPRAVRHEEEHLLRRHGVVPALVRVRRRRAATRCRRRRSWSSGTSTEIAA